MLRLQDESGVVLVCSLFASFRCLHIEQSESESSRLLCSDRTKARQKIMLKKYASHPSTCCCSTCNRRRRTWAPLACRRSLCRIVPEVYHRLSSNQQTMAPLSQCLVLSLAASAAAFSPAGTASTRPTSAVPKTVAFESFGFDFAEDQAENAPPQLLGEARYKQWVGEQNDNSFLNRQVRFTFCALYLSTTRLAPFSIRSRPRGTEQNTSSSTRTDRPATVRFFSWRYRYHTGLGR